MKLVYNYETGKKIEICEVCLHVINQATMRCERCGKSYRKDLELKETDKDDCDFGDIS